MKRIINSVFLFVAAAFILQGCKDDVEYNSTGTDPVSELLSPDDNYLLDLVNNANASLQFKWKAPSDKAAFTYNVVFYTAGGEEICRILADDRGLKSFAEISHDELVSIAGRAGIEPDSEGDIYWNVVSARGTNESVPTAAKRKISLNRYAGFDDIPVSVYIYGEASEAGTDYAKAQKFKSLGNGVFEIFTELEAGKEFQFVNRRSADSKRTFYIDEDDMIREANDATTAQNSGVYRITLDFKTGKTDFREVTDVRYQYCWDSWRTEPLNYVGGGKWKTDEFQLIFNGTDGRYFFYANIGGVTTKLGHFSSDTQEIPELLTGDYFDIFEYPNNTNQWNHCFKFNGELQNEFVTLHIDFSSDFERYSHRIDIGDHNPVPVTKLNNPVNGGVADVFTMGNSSLTFDWDAVAGLGNLPVRYELMFYYDEEGRDQLFLQDDNTKEELPFPSNNNGLDPFIYVPAEKLQALSDKLELDDKGEVVVYWTVRSRILGYRTIADAAPHKLTIRPIAMPKTLTISGSSTEYGSTPERLRKVGGDNEGKFELYTRLTGDDYIFTDNYSRTYHINSSYALESGTSASVNKNGIYIINLDFFNQTATLREVQNVRLHIPVSGNSFTMNYQGSGVWDVIEAVTNWWAGWDDDRFRIWVRIDGTEVKYGSDQYDFNGGQSYSTRLPEGQDPNYYVYPTSDTSDWDYNWKVWSGYRGKTNKRLNLKMNMGPSATHYYIYMEYPDE